MKSQGKSFAGSIWIALLALALCGTSLNAAAQVCNSNNQKVTVVNNSSQRIKNIHYSSTARKGDGAWGRDWLGDGYLSVGYEQEFDMSDGYRTRTMDIRITMDDGYRHYIKANTCRLTRIMVFDRDYDLRWTQD